MAREPRERPGSRKRATANVPTKLVHINRVAKVVKGEPSLGLRCARCGRRRKRVASSDFGSRKAREVARGHAQATVSPPRQTRIESAFRCGKGATLHHDVAGRHGAVVCSCVRLLQGPHHCGADPCALYSKTLGMQERRLPQSIGSSKPLYYGARHSSTPSSARILRARLHARRNLKLSHAPGATARRRRKRAGQPR
jgi:small subunit ribosomal protein S5